MPQQDRPHDAPPSPDPAGIRRQRILEAQARETLRHLDALVQPGWYEAALARQPVDAFARLAPDVLAHANLDEQAVLKDYAAALRTLAQAGMPAVDVAWLAIEVANSVGDQQDLAWLQLAGVCRGLFCSPTWLLARIRRELERDADNAVALLQHAVIAGVLSETQTVAAWSVIADELSHKGQVETVARLGETLCRAIGGSAHEAVTRRTVEAFVMLADDAEPDQRDGWLRRAHALHPDSELIARRLEHDAAWRTDQRRRLIATIACGVVLATAAVVAMQLPV